jgi:hypothetical protein
MHAALKNGGSLAKYISALAYKAEFEVLFVSANLMTRSASVHPKEG